MKKLFLSLLAVALVGFAVNGVAGTVNTNLNYDSTLSVTNGGCASKGMPMELTLGGGGLVVPSNGHSEFDAAVSLSVQPFSKPIWFGISQELGWSPSLAGATDLDAAWAWAVYKDKVYLNTGWSVGATYDSHSIEWRSGPEIELEFYTSGNAFVFAGLNYDLFTHNAIDGWVVARQNALRYDLGVGIAF